MPQIRLQFETEDKTNLEQKAQDLQQQLKQLSSVEDAEALVDDKRFTGLEIVGAISVAIAVTSKTKDFVVELRKLIPELKKLAKTMGFTRAMVKVGGRQLQISEVEKLSDDELEHADAA